MSELAATAQSLRQVREAYQDFLMQWALEELTADAASMAHLARDLSRHGDLGDRALTRNEASHVHRRGFFDD